jgi:hypothetical protein
VFPVRYENYPSCDLNKKAEPWIMSKTVRVILIYHRQKPTDRINLLDS